MPESTIVFAVLAGSLVLFAWGRWRYDVVALTALVVLTLTGVVDVDRAFSGFAHPAVVTVAAVLVASRGLMNAGFVDRVLKRVSLLGSRPTVQVFGLMTIVVALSGFLSSVAAAALFMPVALKMCRRTGTPPSALLMPLAFASLLGAQLTAIGSAPNIIIATFRGENGGAPFRMFDFTPVGGSVALGGIVFVAVVGWRLIPKRERRAGKQDVLELARYVTEVRVTNESPLVGATAEGIEGSADGELTVIGLAVEERRRIRPLPVGHAFAAGDVLVIEADPSRIESLVADSRLELVGTGDPWDRLGSDDNQLIEASLAPGSPLVGKTARGIQLRWQHGVNLLAVSRAGGRPSGRLHRSRLQVGDVLLIEGPEDTLYEAATDLRLLPLAERDLRIGKPRRLALGLGLFATALVATATGIVPVEIAFVVAALVMILVDLLSIDEALASIDGSVVILLGAMIPVGQALETSGGAELIARRLVDLVDGSSATVAIGAILVVTMLLSDVINNAAAAVLMAPIGIGVADGIFASHDPFLMAVAVGASCAFLTPIGHQSNTLVLGPGGYRFGDYWRMGLPLEICVAAISIPAILRFWPP